MHLPCIELSLHNSAKPIGSIIQFVIVSRRRGNPMRKCHPAINKGARPSGDCLSVERVQGLHIVEITMYTMDNNAEGSKAK